MQAKAMYFLIIGPFLYTVHKCHISILCDSYSWYQHIEACSVSHSQLPGSCLYITNYFLIAALEHYIVIDVSVQYCSVSTYLYGGPLCIFA